MKKPFPEMQQVILTTSASYIIPDWGVDAAILRFSDSIASVEITRQRWTNVYRANFNSKVFIYNRF